MHRRDAHSVATGSLPRKRSILFVMSNSRRRESAVSNSISQIADLEIHTQKNLSGKSESISTPVESKMIHTTSSLARDNSQVLRDVEIRKRQEIKAIKCNLGSENIGGTSIAHRLVQQ